MVVVPLDQVYIEANYREVALRHVLPGQHVRIHVDAYDIDLDGVVDSVPPASGAAFAAIQPNNATGNFTKIVQRLPVKIVVSPGQTLARLLRLGFSVETTIHTGLADVADEQRDPARVTAPRIDAGCAGAAPQCAGRLHGRPGLHAPAVDAPPLWGRSADVPSRTTAGDVDARWWRASATRC